VADPLREQILLVIENNLRNPVTFAAALIMLLREQGQNVN
jgi:hypothetical protein